jgi:manganese-dependent inorganic pyrophosphatase
LLASGTPEQILNADRKEFTEDGFLVSISQVEERSLGGFGARREELEAALRELVARRGYHLAVLAMTDIVRHDSLLLAAGQEAVLAKMPFQRLDEALFEAPGVVSRKKQLFPAVCDALHHAK